MNTANEDERQRDRRPAAVACGGNAEIIATRSASKRRLPKIPSSPAATSWCARSSARPSSSTRRWARRRRVPWRRCSPKSMPSRRAGRRSSLNLGARIGEFFASLSPRTLAWSASAAALAILLQAGLIAGIMLNEKGPAGYETASAPTSVSGEGGIGVPTAFQGDYALIRFQPQASAAEITQFLETNNLSVAGGPSAGGLYRVRIAAAKLPKTDLDRLIKTLQENKVVGFIAVTE